MSDNIASQTEGHGRLSNCFKLLKKCVGENQTDKIEKYAQYLKSLYKVQSIASYSDDQWPPPVTDQVFKLAIINCQAEKVRIGYADVDLVRNKTITGKVDNVLRQKVPIELEHVFTVIKGYRKSVLMEGAPGSGKSTLSFHMCRQWTAGNPFYEYKLIILVRLRDLRIQNARSIAELIPRHNELMGQEIEEEITSNDGKHVLFILDGWDELPPNAPSYSMIMNIIKGRKLQECAIIINIFTHFAQTSRLTDRDFGIYQGRASSVLYKMLGEQSPGCGNFATENTTKPNH